MSKKSSNSRSGRRAVYRAALFEMLETRQLLSAVVGIVAIDATATEASATTGKFRLTRDDSVGALDVTLDISGTATNGTDYTTIADTVHFADGAATADVTVTPVDDATYEGSETVIVAIADSTDYDTDADAASDTVTIADNEKPTVSLTVADASATEDDVAATGKFTIARDGPTTGALTVKLTITGTASNGTDYNTISATATIPDGASSVDVTVTPKDDALLEGTEKVTLTLAADTAYLVGTNKTGDVSIADDEVSAVKIVASDATATEGSTLDTGKFTISRTGTGTAIADALVVKFTVSGVATDGTDYDTIGTTATIPAGKSSVDVVIKTKQDTAVELTETAIVTLATDSAYTIVDANKAATVNINDDEKPTVSLAVADASATEDDVAATGKFTISRNGPTTGARAVKLTITGTASNGTDYNTISTTATIPDGDSSVDVTITPKDDALLEGTEKVTLTLAADTAYNVSGTNKTGDVSIADDEIPAIKITASDATATEGSTLDTGKFTITRPGTGTAIADPLVVKFTVAGSATDGTDYDTIGTTATILAGKTSVDLVIKTKQDTGVELTETSIVTLATDSAYTIVDANKAATVNINDDEKPTVSLSASDATAAESGSNNTGKFTFTRNGATTAALTVPFTITGTALKGTDYRSFATSVTIPVGASSKVIEIKPKDDLLLEGDETVIFTLGTGSFLADASHKTDTLTITDDELPTVKLVATDAAAAEPITDKGTLTVTRNGPTTAALVVDLDVSGTATNGTDYDTIADSVTIPKGKTSVTISVAPKDDTSLEGSETVIVALAAGETYDTDADLDSTTVTIKDDEKPVVTIDATDATAAEASAATGTFTITRTGPTVEDLKISYTFGGTAIKGTDYRAIETSATISAGSSTKTITITPIDDTTVELDETMILTLASGTGYTVGTDKTDTVTIAENDKPTVSLVATDPTATEPTTDKAVLTFSRNGPTANALDVAYAVDGASTATSGDDYDALTGTVTIPAGKASITVSVTPKDDTAVEGNETIIVNLSTDADYLRDADKKVANIALKDNDKPTVGLAASDATATEGDTDATGEYTFTRDGATTVALDVLYTITGTAKTGTDTTEVLTGKATIPAGASTKKISIVTADDSDYEGDETIILTMKAGSAYLISGTNKTGTVTITDDDKPMASIKATDASGKEGTTDGIVLTISRTGATTNALGVDLVTSGVAGAADFSAAIPSVVSIPKGKSFVTVSLVAKDDSTYEGTETVDFSIGADSAYDLDSDNNLATVTIIDKQLPTVSITATDAAASEVSHATGTFTITRTTPNTDPVTVTIAVSGTATNGRDFQKLTKTVTIPAGADSKVITITPKTDTLVEASETAIVSLVANATAYKIDDAHKTATVNIADEQKPTISVVAADTPVADTDTVGARFRLWRTGQAINAAAVVKLALTGTATPTANYTVADEDGHAVDISTPSAVSVTIAAGDSYIDLYVIPVSGGSGTVVLTLKADSAYTVDGVLDADSITITSANPAASKLAITQDATAAVAGAVISPAITVQIRDASGNLVTGNTSTVTASISTGPGGATLGGTLTAVAVGGIATFSNLKLTVAGSYKLTFTDGSLTSATSASTFAITAAAAAQLTFGQQPTSTTANSTISPAVTVRIEDQYGNLCTTNTSTVTMAPSPGAAVLSGTLTKAAVAGVATFNDLSLDLDGFVYYLTATDGSLTSAQSNFFLVS